MGAQKIFRYPIRSSDVFGYNDEGQKKPQEDIAADLDFQDNAVEDYLSNDLPNIYIQQSSEGSGQIDPAQLASGTPGAGKAPVGNPPAWTDIATQAELDAHESDTTNVHGIADTSKIPILDTTLQRGVAAFTLDPLTTTTTRAVVFGTAFGSKPRVVTDVECDSDTAPMYTNLIAVSTTGFTYRATSLTVPSTTTATVHWIAVSQ